MLQDRAARLQGQVREAMAGQRGLRIEGGNSKAFYGHPVQGEVLSTREHRGIVHYAPTELVLTARAGTPLAEIEAALAEQNQMLPFEPPRFDAGTEHGATLGGTFATGLSGPRRPWTGAARDFMLGCRVLTGKGDILHFGGEVMKNVAGYDVSRLMTGAQGTLGVLLEISCKVLPRPAAETTLQQALPGEKALAAMNHWAGQPVPLSGAVYHDGVLSLRLSGDARAVDQARRQIGGDSPADADAFWHAIREQQHAFFDDPRPLWRLSLAPAHPPLELAGDVLYDWGGAQRWLLSDEDATVIRARVGNAGGHATLFREGIGGEDTETARFHPLSTPLRRLHLQLKAAFDPQGVLNFGRMYPDL